MGPKVVSNVQFINRVVQRFMHFLSHDPTAVCSTRSTLGCAGGLSGLLLTTFDAFERYQRERAWTFEHQALVRARPILGRRPCRPAFAPSRDHPGDAAARGAEEAILAMRERIREAKGGPSRPSRGFARSRSGRYRGY